MDFISTYQKVPVTECTNSASQQPVVSVCVQTYNHVKYIKVCLDGIIMQKTELPVEILLGEDESNDGTREICIEYANRYPEKIRLFLHSREYNIKINGKPTGRFNFLYNLSKARGKYIALCEGDDYWTDPLKLQKQVEFLEENPEYSMCFHRVNVVDEDTMDEPKQLYDFLEEKDYTGQELIRRWTVPTCSVIFRRALINNNSFTHPGIIYGDLLLFLSCAEKGKIRCLSDNMATYRRHSLGALRTTVNNYHLRKKNYKTLAKLFNGKYKAGAYRKIAHTAFNLSILELKKKNIASACSYLLKAFYYKPIYTANKLTRAFYSHYFK